MKYELRKLHPLFAAEITGFNTGADQTPELVAFIEDAMAEYAVVVLPGQDISDDQKIAFAAWFGPRESPAGGASGFAAKRNRLPKFLFDASNLGLDNEILPANHLRRV